MFCKKCGEEIDNEAVVCPKCGCSTKQENSDPKFREPKTGMGVLMGLFLGIIGLIIGIVIYPEGTVARKTFIKAWLTTFLICFAIGVILGIILVTLASGAIYNYYY